MSAHPIRSVPTAGLALVAALAVLAGPTAVATASPSSSSPASAPVSAATGTPYPVTLFRLQGADPEEMRAAWQEWTRRALVDYVTVVDNGCYCVGSGFVASARTEVRGPQVVSVRDRKTWKEVRLRGYEITGLYRLLRRGYRESDGVSVTFDRGVPVRIRIDWREEYVDDETVLDVSLHRPPSQAAFSAIT